MTPLALIQIVDAAAASAYERGGAHLLCRPGCTQCCIGVFPIAQQDAARLRDGFALAAPTTQQAIHARVTASLARLDPWFPGDGATGILSAGYEETILFEEFANDEVCPVLDPATGTCDLYEHRPILCRTFGPPMLQPGDEGEMNLGTCELCLTHASPEEVAAAQLDPHLPEIEAASNAAFDAEHHTHGETLIAHALCPAAA